MAGVPTKVDCCKGSSDCLGANADVPDGATGLTPRDLHHINTTWAVVRQNMKQHGWNFFIEFFTKHPEIKERFGPFGGVPIEELKKSRRLAGHGATVFASIDSYIRNLDDAECVVQMIKTTGVNHKNRGVTVAEFGLLPDVLVAYLKKTFAAEWTPSIEASWKKLLNLVITLATSVY